MIRHYLGLGFAALFLLVAPVHAQGISQKVAVCNPGFTSRCVAPDASGNTPVVGTVTVVPSGTQDVNLTQVGGNSITTTVPVSDAGGSLTVDTLQLPSTLGVKTAANSLSVAPASDSTFPVTQSGTWNINNVSGTISLPTGAATAANQATGNASLSSIDTKLTAPLSVSQSGSWSNTVTQPTASSLNATVVGAASSGSAVSGNPVLAGGSDGTNVRALQTTAAGALVVGGSNTTGSSPGSAQGLMIGASDGTNYRNASSDTSGRLNVNSQGTVASGATDSGNPVKIGGVFLTSPTSVTNGQRVDARMTTTGAVHVAIDPTSDAASAITPAATSAAASNVVVKASAGNLYGFQATAGASAGYVMLFNATSLPADGAVTPLKCYAVAANSTISVDFRSGPPVRFGTGITIGFSTTGCFTLTASATAFISGDAQ